MSDDLVDGLVEAAQAGMKLYQEDAYDRVRDELQVLGRVLALTEGGVEHRELGLSLLEHLTEPVLTDIAVEVVRAIVKVHGGTTVRVTRPWFDTLALDRAVLAKRSGLEVSELESVLAAMFEKLRTSESLADVDGIIVKMTPEDRSDTARSSNRDRSKAETDAPEEAKKVSFEHHARVSSKTTDPGRSKSPKSQQTAQRNRTKAKAGSGR